MLSVARRSATKARTQAINQLHALVVPSKHQLLTRVKASRSQAALRRIRPSPKSKNSTNEEETSAPAPAAGTAAKPKRLEIHFPNRMNLTR